MAGLLCFVSIILFVMIGPWLWGVDPGALDTRNRFAAPSLAHPMGTMQLGQDVMAQVMFGGRISLAVGLVAMVITILLGTLIGVLAGFFKALDGILMRLTDLFLALPVLPLLLVIIMLFREPLSQRFGTEAGIFILMVSVIGITSWMPVARIVRGDILAIKEREFILAARSIGTPSRRLILKHILPNVLSPIMVSGTLAVANAIITESALSYLGLGFPSDFPTWGKILIDAVQYTERAPWMVIFPGVLISLTVLSVNYMGDGMRDALDPRGIRGTPATEIAVVCVTLPFALSGGPQPWEFTNDPIDDCAAANACDPRSRSSPFGDAPRPGSRECCRADGSPSRNAGDLATGPSRRTQAGCDRHPAGPARGGDCPTSAARHQADTASRIETRLAD
jgi:peptide/nickel transport system permease protein